jgi:hypothetical protein
MGPVLIGETNGLRWQAGPRLEGESASLLCLDDERRAKIKRLIPMNRPATRCGEILIMRAPGTHRRFNFLRSVGFARHPHPD